MPMGAITGMISDFIMVCSTSGLTRSGSPTKPRSTETRSPLLGSVLDANFLEQAAQAGNRELVTLILADLAGVADAKVRRILSARTAKPIVALVWHAHLPMRAAFRLQTYVMRLPAHELLPARGGVHFPLSKEEMRWHLSYFDIAI